MFDRCREAEQERAEYTCETSADLARDGCSTINGLVGSAARDYMLMMRFFPGLSIVKLKITLQKGYICSLSDAHPTAGVQGVRMEN